MRNKYTRPGAYDYYCEHLADAFDCWADELLREDIEAYYDYPAERRVTVATEHGSIVIHWEVESLELIDIYWNRGEERS